MWSKLQQYPEKWLWEMGKDCGAGEIAEFAQPSKPSYSMVWQSTGTVHTAKETFYMGGPDCTKVQISPKPQTQAIVPLSKNDPMDPSASQTPSFPHVLWLFLIKPLVLSIGMGGRVQTKVSEKLNPSTQPGNQRPWFNWSFLCVIPNFHFPYHLQDIALSRCDLNSNKGMGVYRLMRHF